MKADLMRVYAAKWLEVANAIKAIHDELVRDHETVPRLSAALDAACLAMGIAECYRVRADQEDLSR